MSQNDLNDYSYMPAQPILPPAPPARRLSTGAIVAIVVGAVLFGVIGFSVLAAGVFAVGKAATTKSASSSSSSGDTVSDDTSGIYQQGYDIGVEVASDPEHPYLTTIEAWQLCSSSAEETVDLPETDMENLVSGCTDGYVATQ